MHELAITQNVLEIVLREAEKAHAEQVKSIQLVIGDLAGIVDDSVQFYFDFISQDTPARGATLSFRRITTRFRCRACGTEFTPEGQDWCCPSCSSPGGEVVAGREFYIESIEVE